MVREWEIVDTCEIHIEYFMASSHELLTYQNHRMHPYRALFMWYCVYYIHSHSEKLFVLPAVYLKFFQNGKICFYTSRK